MTIRNSFQRYYRSTTDPSHDNQAAGIPWHTMLIADNHAPVPQNYQLSGEVMETLCSLSNGFSTCFKDRVHAVADCLWPSVSDQQRDLQRDPMALLLRLCLQRRRPIVISERSPG